MFPLEGGPGGVDDEGGKREKNRRGLNPPEVSTGCVTELALDQGPRSLCHHGSLYWPAFSIASGDSAGPERTFPCGVKREPWHGQSHVCSTPFHATTQPRCVQTGESRVTLPCSLRYAASRLPSISTILPSPRRTARSDRASGPTKRSRIK